MTKAKEMAKLTKESAYNKHKTAIEKNSRFNKRSSTTRNKFLHIKIY